MDGIINNLNDSGLYVDIDSVHDLPKIEYLSHPLNGIWERRGTKPLLSDPAHWKSILDVCHGEDDICMYQPYFCFHCSCPHAILVSTQVAGAALLVASIFGMKQVRQAEYLKKDFHLTVLDWEYLRGVEPLNGLPLLFEGTLSSGLVEAQSLRDQLDDQAFTYTSFLQEIHDIRISEFHTWDKQDWLCLQCLRKIIQAHLHLWLLERKRKGRLAICLFLADEHI